MEFNVKFLIDVNHDLWREKRKNIFAFRYGKCFLAKMINSP